MKLPRLAGLLLLLSIPLAACTTPEEQDDFGVEAGLLDDAPGRDD